MLNTPCVKHLKKPWSFSVAQDTENVHAKNDQAENSMHTRIVS